MFDTSDSNTISADCSKMAIVLILRALAFVSWFMIVTVSPVAPLQTNSFTFLATLNVRIVLVTPESSK